MKNKILDTLKCEVEPVGLIIGNKVKKECGGKSSIVLTATFTVNGKKIIESYDTGYTEEEYDYAEPYSLVDYILVHVKEFVLPKLLEKLTKSAPVEKSTNKF